MRPKPNSLSYDKAKELIQKNNVRNRAQYRAFRKTSKKYEDILPYDYEKFWGEVYNSEDFFGTYKYDYDTLMKVLKENNIKNLTEYRKFRKISIEHGIHIPFEPKLVYPNWKGFDMEFYALYL